LYLGVDYTSTTWETLNLRDDRLCLRRTWKIESGLEHVPKKLTDFFDLNMLQVFESERFLFDQMILSDREAF
jgi:hypothetical protein